MTLVPLTWGDDDLTWGGEPLLVDPDEWDALMLRLGQILARINRAKPGR